MSRPDRDSTTPPELAGPIDDRFVYRLTKEGEKALAEYERANGKPTSTKLRCTETIAEVLEAEDWRDCKRRRRKEAENAAAASSPHAPLRR